MESSKVLGIVCCSGICRRSDLAIELLNFADLACVTKLTESHAHHIFIIVHNLDIYMYIYVFVPCCLTQGLKNGATFPDHDVIAGSVSQNCGRQPHIVSTNHSNLIAVGPNRSLASRQAIVWTYRPRVEATESQPPDFLRSESCTDGKKNERALLRDFQFSVRIQAGGRKKMEAKSCLKNSIDFHFSSIFILF